MVGRAHASIQVLFVHIRWLLLGWLANSEELIAASQTVDKKLNFTQFYTINIHIQLQHVDINLRAYKHLGIRIICKEENYRLNIITVSN